MYSLRLDMWESSQGTKPTAQMKKALVQIFFFFLRQAVLYRIDSLLVPNFLQPWFSPPSPFHGYLLRNPNKLILAGVNYYPNTI